MIADRTYHRVLHVDWIRADVDGDGVPENVPQSDRLGRTEPQRIYTAFLDAGAGASGFDTALLCGRKHLPRLGERARELQRDQLTKCGSAPAREQHLHVHVVSASMPRTARSSGEAARAHSRSGSDFA